jgi:mycothiol synthase
MNGFEIRTCPDTDLQTALKVLHAGLSADQQAALVLTLDCLARGDDSPFEGLYVAYLAGEVIAATWVQFTPGNAAVVWPPAFDSPAAVDLMTALEAIMQSRRTALGQILFAATDEVNESILAVAGFQRLADLAYLTLERSNFPNPSSPKELQFEPFASEKIDRLESVIKQSYQATLDCPELNDLRDPADVVSGYKVQGKFDPQHWYLVRKGDQDVGVLILTEHAAGENWELVYMGITPSARGHGFGEMIVRYAIEKTRESSAERLVLAVDERNLPAWEMYRRVGFVMWDRRTVYARLSNQQS